MLINLLNQEGIYLEVDCVTHGKIKVSSNAVEDNLQSSTEAGNSNIDTQTNNMICRQYHSKESLTARACRRE